MTFNKINRNVWLTFLTLIIISSQYYCSSVPSDTPASGTTTEKKELSKTESLAEGKYLINTGGCSDCHSPKIMTAMGPMPDTSKLLSGHPAGSPLPPITYDGTKPGNWMLFSPDLTTFIGPWGMSFSANLTPDSTTGLGTWTTENFIKTMRTGKHLGQEGGRPILPPMPWQPVGEMTDEDLSLMFDYLKTIPAIKNQVPVPVPPNEVMNAK